ncbi:hypothetical protein [Pseudomonas viridiflava]
MVKICDGMLIERFIAQELGDSVRSILEAAFEERVRSSVLLMEFEFNCFDVSLDFENGIVTLQDVLSVGESSFLDMPIFDFATACSLNVSCWLQKP